MPQELGYKVLSEQPIAPHLHGERFPLVNGENVDRWQRPDSFRSMERLMRLGLQLPAAPLL